MPRTSRIPPREEVSARMRRFARSLRGRGATAAFDPDAPADPAAGLFGLSTRPQDAGVVVVPVPFEATTSYGGGTSGAPEAVLRASHQVDLLDGDFGPIHEAGIAMLPVPGALLRLSKRAQSAARLVIDEGPKGSTRPGVRRAIEKVDAAGEQVNDWVRAQAAPHLERGAIVGVLGGDHSVPFGLIAELAERHPGMGVLHVDAHCDLRDAYEGFAWSHASIMNCVLERIPGVRKLVQVGIRDFGERELALVDGSRGRVRTFFDCDVRRDLFAHLSWDAFCREVVDALPEQVHVSFDIDGLSPDHCPHTGTPVPGGLSFAEAAHLLRVLSERRQVVGFDLCEVTPGPDGDEWDANVGARVLYKLIGCAVRSGKPRPKRKR